MIHYGRWIENNDPLISAQVKAKPGIICNLSAFPKEPLVKPERAQSSGPEGHVTTFQDLDGPGLSHNEMMTANDISPEIAISGATHSGRCDRTVRSVHNISTSGSCDAGSPKMRRDNLKPVARGHGVVIEQRDDVALGDIEPGVQRRDHPRLIDRYKAPTRMRWGLRLKPDGRLRVIIGAVADDDFDDRSQHGLRGLKEGRQSIHASERRRDDADVKRHGGHRISGYL
jgi:hypothetical protein